MDVLPQPPVIDCPFPSRIHPAAQLAEDHVRYYGRRFGLVVGERSSRRFDRAGFGLFAARTCPEVGDVELMAEWAAWLFVFDDEFDEAGDPAGQAALIDPVLAEMRRILIPELNFSGSPSNAYAAALAEMWPRTARLMSRSWRIRFAHHLCQYVESYKSELSNRRFASAPSLQEYLPFRRIVSAVDVCWDMIEAGLGRSLPEHVVDSDPCQELRLAANDITCWTNDIISLNKEHARGDLNNLVAVLRAEQSLSLVQAAHRVVNMIHTRTADFLNLREALPAAGEQLVWHSQDRQLLQRCAEAMGWWIAGSRDWHLSSERYRDIEYTEPRQAPSYYLPLLSTCRTGRRWA